jgi:hypothetical protein
LDEEEAMRKSIRSTALSVLATFLVLPAAAQAQAKVQPTPATGATAQVQPSPPPGPGAPAATARTEPVAQRAPADPAPGGLRIDGNNASLKLGFLVQPATEYQSQAVGSNEAAQYFFLRRARIMLGITLGSSFELFAETDSPNLGKPSQPGQMLANTVGTNIQDAFVTWKRFEQFKIDAGMMLLPFLHNSLQSASSLYGWDYYAYSFQQNAGLGGYVWRDTGLQVRGLLLGHLEYRAGVFTGKRQIPPPAPAGAPVVPGDSRTVPRLAGRVQYNVFDPETAFFYAGTYAGSKRILSFGAGIDHQDTYNAWALDGFFDWPVGADVVTGQLVFARYDGGSWIALPKHNVIMAEAGYRFGTLKLSPIVRVEQLMVDAPTPMSSDQTRYAAGLAWWYMGHNANLKLFYTYARPDSATQSAYSQVNLQMQLYVF